MTNRFLPHYKVYTRLGVSKIHGIGVFAISNIKKQTKLFYNDNDAIKWVHKKHISKLPKRLKEFYSDFCILRGDYYGCPNNFNDLTITWYLNHSDKPNVYCDKKYIFYSLRNIRVGEELTIDYNSFSEDSLF